ERGLLHDPRGLVRRPHGKRDRVRGQPGHRGAAAPRGRGQRQWWTQVVGSAVTDREGQATLHVLARHQGSSSLARQRPDVLDRWDEVPHPLPVPATTLDAFLGPDPSPIDLLKIDAEGWEPAVFDGMRGLLAHSPHLRTMIEFTPALVANAGRDAGAFLGTL